LEANAITPFFTTTQGIEEQMEEYLDVTPTLPISTIIEKCL
jgi:hypothetical protein